MTKQKPAPVDPASKITVAPGYVIVKPNEVQETVSGIYQPGKEKEIPQFGEVMVVGEKTEDDRGLDLKPGQMVIYKEWGGNKVMLEGQKYYFLKYEEVIGAVK